jgi:bifunctional non-homologous end joining protein LigD
MKSSTTGSASWREGDRVRLFTRNGYDFTARFPKIAAAVEELPVRSCVVDGEAIVVNREGLSVFDLLYYRQHGRAAVLCAFDLIEFDGYRAVVSASSHRRRMRSDCYSAYRTY